MHDACALLALFDVVSLTHTCRQPIASFLVLVNISDMDKIIAEIESPNREIARSFMSWANAESHSAFDDEVFVNTEKLPIHTRRRLIHL